MKPKIHFKDEEALRGDADMWISAFAAYASAARPVPAEMDGISQRAADFADLAVIEFRKRGACEES